MTAHDLKLLLHTLPLLDEEAKSKILRRAGAAVASLMNITGQLTAQDHPPPWARRCRSTREALLKHLDLATCLSILSLLPRERMPFEPDDGTAWRLKMRPGRGYREVPGRN